MANGSSLDFCTVTCSLSHEAEEGYTEDSEQSGDVRMTEEGVPPSNGMAGSPFINCTFLGAPLALVSFNPGFLCHVAALSAIPFLPFFPPPSQGWDNWLTQEEFSSISPSHPTLRGSSGTWWASIFCTPVWSGLAYWSMNFLFAL
jgi:hypothetical protein